MAVVFDNVSYGKIKNVSFDVEDGKITGIIGPRGCGKSILIDLMGYNFYPESGDILSEDNVGIVYQNICDQFFYSNIKEEFLFNLKINNVKNIEKKMYDAVKMVGFNLNILNKSFHELSLSEQKKISLALVLSLNPKCILLDDIFFGLDNKDKKSIVKLIRMLKIRFGKTVVVTSCDSDLIHQISENVILMNDGEVIKCGNKYDIFTNDVLLNKCNLSVPKVIEFSKLVELKKKIKLGYRDDINDLMKDIYRFVR